MNMSTRLFKVTVLEKEVSVSQEREIIRFEQTLDEMPDLNALASALNKPRRVRQKKQAIPPGEAT